MTDTKILNRPAFIHVGPQRCGTTTLYRVLSRNGIVPTDVKEIQFFDRNYKNGIQWYLRHFDKFDSDAIVGEVCPTYFMNPSAVERIYKHLPEIKIICTLRDPLSRTISYYRLLRMYNQCPKGLEKAWELDGHLRNCSMYTRALENWIKRYQNKIKILVFDDLINNPNEYMNEFLRFIGIHSLEYSSANIPGPKKEAIPKFPILNHHAANIGFFLRNRGHYRLLEILRAIFRPMIFNLGKSQNEIEVTELIKEKIRAHYRSDIIKLEKILGRSLGHWYLS